MADGLLTAERQRSVNIAFGEKLDSAAMAAKMFDKPNFKAGNWNGNKVKGQFVRRAKEEKARLICDHCGGPGHDTTTCFKLHGVPDWYKELKDKQRNYAKITEHDSEIGRGLVMLTEKEDQLLIFLLSYISCKR